MKTIFGVLLAVLSILNDSNAQNWSGEIEAGYVSASGNTDSESINAGLHFIKENDRWLNDVDLSVYRSTNDGLVSADSLDANYTLKRFVGERGNLFLSLGYLDDEFDGFTEKISAALGYGYRFYDSETYRWEMGIGAGYRDTNEIILPPVTDGSSIPASELSISGATFVARSDFWSQITDNTQFLWELSAEVGADNSFYQSDSALEVGMSDRFSLKAQLIVRHNTDPALETKDTDTITLLSLVYSLTN